MADARLVVETNVLGSLRVVRAVLPAMRARRQEVIVNVSATTPDHPLRRPVGADAELIATLRRELDDETFERTVRTALDFWD